jgi:hypothetical protein
MIPDQFKSVLDFKENLKLFIEKPETGPGPVLIVVRSGFSQIGPGTRNLFHGYQPFGRMAEWDFDRMEIGRKEFFWTIDRMMRKRPVGRMYIRPYIN